MKHSKDSFHSHFASVCKMFFTCRRYVPSHSRIFMITKRIELQPERKNTLKIRLLLFAVNKEVHQYYRDCYSSKQEELQPTTHFSSLSFLCLPPPPLGLSSPPLLLHFGPHPRLVMLASLLLPHRQLLFPQCLLLTFINLKTRALQ